MSPQSEEPSPQPVQEFSNEERAVLLALAHKSIAAALEGQTVSLDSPLPHLTELRGVFTTLYLQGQLRGCVGYVFPTSPLYRTVAETAQAAAFQDSRFHPVTHEEAPALKISLSILSPLAPIRAEDIEVGKHGLVVSMAGRRGLLLPQVPVEQGWNRIQFLEQTSRKAGLPMNAWQSGAKLEAFTAEVFSDKDLK
jgi:AmmeMemoRadiSam system protein A